MFTQSSQIQPQGTLVDELGLSDFPEEKKSELLEKMTEAILKRIFLETMYRLNEEEKASYEKMIDDNAGPEEVEEFLRKKISGYGEMVKNIIEDFEEKMKSST